MTIIKTKNILEFIIKRFARLYPGYIFCGVTTLVFYTFFDLPGREVNWYEGFMNLIFANFIPGLNFKYIDGIYWALIVEIKFYIFFSIIYFASKNLKYSINFWVIFCILGNFLKYFSNENFIFLTSIFPHANLFLLGLTIFAFKDLNLYNRLGILIFVFASIFFDPRFQENLYLFYFLFFCVFITLYKKINLNFKILTFTGLISYTWYLIHNAVGIIIIREMNKLYLFNYSFFIAAISTFIFSILIYFFIEKKLKRLILNYYYLKINFMKKS